MLKIQNKLMKFLMPIANKLEQQNHIQSIKDGITAVVPIIIVGSFCSIFMGINNLFSEGAIHDFLNSNIYIFTYPIAFTTDMLAIYATYFISRALASRYELNTTTTPVTSLIFFFMVAGVVKDGRMNTSYLGATGLFTGILVALISVEIYRLCIRKKLYIKLPESVPPMVQESFASLIPLVVNAILAVIISILSIKLFGNAFPQLLMDILAPAISSMDSLIALILVVFLTQLLWFFGLHGPSITSAVWATFAISYEAENVMNYTNGNPVTHIFTFGLFFALLQVSGSGLTMGLNILLIRSKSKTFNSVGKAALIPGLFGINEPLIFGMPIILNPFMFIPFVVGPVICTIITYFAMTLGLVGKPIASPPGFLPPGVGAFLMTLDWKVIILVCILLIFMTVFYYPFFKMIEKEEIAKEKIYNFNGEL